MDKSGSRLHLREKENREEEGRKGKEKGVWDSKNYYSSAVLHWQNVMLMCVHPTTAESVTHLYSCLDADGLVSVGTG